jgi:hypothetical protein
MHAMTQQFVVGHPQYFDSATSEVVVANVVGSLLPSMRASVEFDGQPRGLAEEVRDIGSERLLPTEL